MNGPFAAWRRWQDRRMILRDIRRRAADANEVNHFKIKDQLVYAEAALDNNDNRRATEICNKLIADHPPEAYRSPLALKVLLRLRRFDDATKMVLTGQRRSRGDPNFLLGLAQIAQARRDHPEAVMHYAKMRKYFPGVMEGYTSAAEALRLMGKPADAESLAVQAMRQFPDHIAGFLERARLAVHREDWEEALRCWKPIRDQFEYVGAYVGAAQAFTHLQRYDEAEEVLQQARYRFGTNPSPLCEYARVAEAKGDTAEAIQRWKAVLYRFPLDMPVYSDASQAFERLGDPAEAETTLRAAVDRFPLELRPRIELAKLLLYQHLDFDAAVDAWSSLRQVLPDNEEAYVAGADALQKAGRTDAAAALRADHHQRFRV